MSLVEDVWPGGFAIAARHDVALQEVKQMVAGGVAGCISKSCVAPLSRVTILMQVQSMRPHKYVGSTPNNTRLAASLWKIYREEGFWAYWRGNGATCLHRFPYTATTFWGHRWLKEKLEGTMLDRTPSCRSFFAAGMSASCAVLLWYPLDVVKTRLSAQTSSLYYSGISDALVKIRRDEGVSGLYRGLPVTVCSVAPMIACNFAFFENFHRSLQGCGMQPWLHALSAGGLAGAMASALLFPVDLLRRQMQMVGVGGRPVVYRNVSEAVRHIYSQGYRTGSHRTEFPHWLRGIPVFFGIREFFRGLLPELMKVTPNAGILFCVNDYLMTNKWPYEPPKY